MQRSWIVLVCVPVALAMAGVVVAGSSDVPPPEVRDLINQQNKGEFHEVSARSHELLEEEAYPLHRGRLRFYRGDSLYRLGFVVGAQEFFAQVVDEKS